MSLLVMVCVPAPAMTEEEMHAVLIEGVRQVNQQMSGARMDARTTLRFVTYARGIKTFTYYYNVDAASAAAAGAIDPAEFRASMDAYNRKKTCTAKLAAFMRGFGLRVVHQFQDESTGDELLRLEYVAADCKGYKIN